MIRFNTSEISCKSDAQIRFGCGSSGCQMEVIKCENYPDFLPAHSANKPVGLGRTTNCPDHNFSRHGTRYLTQQTGNKSYKIIREKNKATHSFPLFSTATQTASFAPTSNINNKSPPGTYLYTTANETVLETIDGTKRGSSTSDRVTHLTLTHDQVVRCFVCGTKTCDCHKFPLKSALVSAPGSLPTSNSSWVCSKHC